MHSAQIKYNDRYSEFYKQLYNETHEKRYLNKADSIFNCFKFQYWDKYEYNKIFLLSVNSLFFQLLPYLEVKFEFYTLVSNV